jgi:hypothetical protein
MQECLGVTEHEIEYVLLDISQTIEHTLSYLEELRETVSESEVFN